MQLALPCLQLVQAVGDFLGEGFAMCDTLRLAFFSRCEFWNTGVVGALVEARRGLAWPSPQFRKVRAGKRM